MEAVKKEKVLVFDDCPDTRMLYNILLKKKGYEIVEAGTLEEAESHLEKSVLGLCIVDYRLGCGGSTEPFCRRVKATSEIPILMITGKERDPALYNSWLLKASYPTGAFLDIVDKLYFRSNN